MKTGIGEGLLGPGQAHDKQGQVDDRAQVHGRLGLDYMEQEQGRKHYMDSHRVNDLRFFPRVEDHFLFCHF